jgi:hypothetical protein
MSSRYITGAMSSLLGAFVVVATQAFAASAVSWIAAGIGIAIVAVTFIVQLDRSRGSAQRALDGGTVVVGGLLIGFALAASASTAIWLSFAFALGIVALAYAGLTLNEVSNWRAAHQLGELRWLHEEQFASSPAGTAGSRAA